MGTLLWRVCIIFHNVGINGCCLYCHSGNTAFAPCSAYILRQLSFAHMRSPQNSFSCTYHLFQLRLKASNGWVKQACGTAYMTLQHALRSVICVIKRSTKKQNPKYVSACALLITYSHTNIANVVKCGNVLVVCLRPFYKIWLSNANAQHQCAMSNRWPYSGMTNRCHRRCRNVGDGRPSVAYVTYQTWHWNRHACMLLFLMCTWQNDVKFGWLPTKHCAQNRVQSVHDLFSRLVVCRKLRGRDGVTMHIDSHIAFHDLRMMCTHCHCADTQ